MYNYEYMIFWLLVTLLGFVLPAISVKYRKKIKWYLGPSLINILGTAYLFWEQEQSIATGQSDWGFIVPLGSVYFLAPLTLVTYIAVTVLIKLDYVK